MISRREALKKFGLGAATIATVGTVGGLTTTAGAFISPDDVEAEGRFVNYAGVTDIDILNFALNLEYLEAEFYSYTTTGSGISPSLTRGVGREGATTGGVITNFADPVLQGISQNIAADELDHVKYLRKALGAKAVGKPAITLDPLGSAATQNAFLTYARAFEDTGVSAYGGAATLIRSTAILGVAARILATEAYHSGSIRTFAIQNNLTLSKLDSKDVPPTLSTAFTVNSQALSITRSVKEVLKIVKPFFPKGLNGNIK